MPWLEVSTMSSRAEFVRLGAAGGVTMAELCRRFGISRKTGYKWRKRYASDGPAALQERSRRPHYSPARTSSQIEQATVQLRQHHRWGGRKIQRRLQMLGYTAVPAASTLSGVLKRHGLIDPNEALKHHATQRFERCEPNELWQMDFKGHFAIDAGRCHPLTVLDDHSRYSVALRACANERGDTVKQALIDSFERYGLPQAMLMDNGAPWGNDAEHVLTPLTVWLIRLGIRVRHSRPYHPQTQGKDERFHRSLNVELIQGARFRDWTHCQQRFDWWREVYNLQRPHEALDLQVPAHRYRPSAQRYPSELPRIEYGPDDQVRKVQSNGEFAFHGQLHRVAKALRGHPIALRPTAIDGCWQVFFCQQHLKDLDLRPIHP